MVLTIYIYGVCVGFPFRFLFFYIRPRVIDELGIGLCITDKYDRASSKNGALRILTTVRALRRHESDHIFRFENEVIPFIKYLLRAVTY